MKDNPSVIVEVVPFFPHTRRLMHRVMQSRTFPVIIILPLACIYFAFFHRYTAFNDFTYLGTDTWVYQSMAVNVARGHGLNRFGGAEPFVDYHFGDGAWNLKMNALDTATFTDRRDHFMKEGQNGGELTTNRLPLYPLFMGAIYALAGIHPFIIKNVQLFLLALVGAGLPLLGSLWWKRGLLAGLLAGAPMVAMTMRFANEILSESLTIFVLFLCVLGAALYQQRPGSARAILLGALLGLCLITKLSLVLLPFIFLGLFCVNRRAHHQPFLRHFLLMIGAAVIVVLPWSLYISIEARSPIVFSTESFNHGLFDAHNEYTAKDGIWHPEWRTNPDSIYLHDGMGKQSDFLRIMHFYLVSPDRIIRLPLSKLIAAFTTMPSIVLLTILLMLEGLLGSHLLQNPFVRVGTLALGVGYWWHLTADDFLHKALQPLVITGGVWWLLLGFIILCILLARRFLNAAFPRFPLMVTAVILNFLLITVIVMADPAVYLSRHVKTAEFAFLLLLMYTLLEWVCAPFRSSFQKNNDH